MERSKEQLLELTRCALWGSQLNIELFEQGVEWSKVLQLAKEQTILGVISTSIERLPLSLQPTRIEVLRLHQMVTLNRAYHKHQIEVLAKLLELVKRAGVERPVLLKGLGVGLNYPDPTLRQCGDIDLYVGEKHYFKVWDLVCAEFGCKREESPLGHHFNFEFMETHIEIHRYVNSTKSIAFRNREFLQWSASQLEGEELREVSIDGVSVLLPPYNFDLIFIFYHTWRHFFVGGVGLRQVCDWACYADAFADKANIEELKRVINYFKLYPIISLFATIAVKELGVAPEKFSNYASTTKDNYKKVLDKIWSGGNFGVYNKRQKPHSKTIFERKCRTLWWHIQNMAFLFDIDKVYIIKSYTSLFSMLIVDAIKQHKTFGNKL
ncbi:MAG: nucleotidyltransferase family protein [Rikenellaceae bacterium]